METEGFREGELDELSRGLRDEASRMHRMSPRFKVNTAARGTFAVLHVLVIAERSLSPGELARRCGISDARIANILRTLEDRGYIERHVSSADRRRVEVRLTPAGRASHDGQFEVFRSCMNSLLLELGEHDARELLRIMRRANDIVERRLEEKGRPRA